MTHTVIVNGSPNKASGATGRILALLAEGLQQAGSTTETLYPQDMDLELCDGEMHCWFGSAGECYHQDAMQAVYLRMRMADILVLAAPVYIPLPGKMQVFMNRLCPLMLPKLEYREGRTRARFRDDVKIRTIAGVITGGWYERENSAIVARVFEELTENTSCAYAGSLIRPHAQMLSRASDEARAAVEGAVRRAGVELARDGAFASETLAAAGEPVVEAEALLRRLNLRLERLLREQRHAE